MNTLKLITLVIILLFLNKNLSAQISIDGTITDSDLNPIGDVFVQIIDETDTFNIYSSTTNEFGYFSISGITDVESSSLNIPDNIILLRNYPNPFNPTTIIYYELPKAEIVEITIYDVLGRAVRTLFNNFHNAGTYTLEWNGRNDRNTSVAAGIYFCRLKTKTQFKVHKMVLLDGGRHLLATPRILNQSITNSNQIEKTNKHFSFTFRVSGENVISTEFNHIVCNGDTSISFTVSKILKTEIIGSQGGVVILDNFSMNIPEGAFDSDFELKLFEKDADEWDKDNISKIIGVEGLPLKYNSPLDITIVLEEQLIEESYITVGQEYEFPFANFSEIVYKFMETKDSLGILKCELPISFSPTEINMAKSKSSKYKQHKTYFTAKTGFITQLSYNKHFKIFDKKYEYWLIKQLGNTLEWNYNLLRDDGFDTTSVNWPVEVYVKKLNPNIEKRGCIYYPTFGIKNISLLIDQDRINNIRYSSLREYTIGILRTYDQDFFLPNEFTGKVDPSRYWFHHATASWFEEKKNKQWDDDFPYFPIDFQNSTILHVFNEGSGDNRLAPFSGMLAGAGSTSLSSLKHGGGMSSFIKYLDLNYGSGLILLIYDQIKKDRIRPIEAINNLMSDSYLWWPDYLENYMESNIYEPFDKEGSFNPYDEPKPLYDIIAGEHTFENKVDTIKSFKEVKYHPLSAKVYKIGWSTNAFDTLRVLRISTTDLNNNTLFVYGEVGHDYVLLGKGVSFLMSIKELLRTQVNGNNIGNLRVVATNSECDPPYNNLTDISLEIKLEKMKGVQFKHCDIKIAVQSIVDTFIGGWSPAWYTDGTFTDNVYNGTINPTRQGGSNVHGTVRIEIDNDYKIVSLNVMAYHSDQYGSSQWGITAANVPMLEHDPYLLLHRIYGNSVCSYVTSIYAKYTYPDGTETEITKYKCVDESLLQVKFHNWD